MQILYSVYSLDYLDGIMEENIYCRCEAVVLRTVSEIGLFLELRL